MSVWYCVNMMANKTDLATLCTDLPSPAAHKYMSVSILIRYVNETMSPKTDARPKPQVSRSRSRPGTPRPRPGISKPRPQKLVLNGLKTKTWSVILASNQLVTAKATDSSTTQVHWYVETNRLMVSVSCGSC